MPLRIVEAEGFRLPAEPAAQPLVFVALGSGAAPMFAFLEQLARARRDGVLLGGVDVTLVWGLREPAHLHLEDELLRYVDALGLKLLVCFSRADAELEVLRADAAAGRPKPALRVVPGARKRITTALTLGAWPKAIYDLIVDDAVFYLCGHPSLQGTLRTVLEHAMTIGGDLAPADAAAAYETMVAEEQVRADLFFSGAADAGPRLYSRADVARHHELDDLWVIFRGLVYDLTGYAALHPGGAKLLFDKK